MRKREALSCCKVCFLIKFWLLAAHGISRCNKKSSPQISALNKFRLANHQLRNETGRYTVLKTPEHLRICSLCQANVVENECHVMFYRILCDKLRDKFFNEITEKYNFFKDLNERSKLLFLFLKQYWSICL